MVILATSRAPKAALYPAIPHKHDAADIAHLTPRQPKADGAPLFYAQDESSGRLFIP